MPDQLPLFSLQDPAEPDLSAELERRFERLRRLAAAMPPELRMGTSSWTFPGWAGLVYPGPETSVSLARDGLRHYVRHPLFRCVGIDRGYYAAIPEADLRRYGEQLPPGFLCCTKAPAAVTSPTLPRTAEPNPNFLSAGLFRVELLEPFERHLKENAGPFIIQFPSLAARMGETEFLERLDCFLAGLPGHFRYCVEVRDGHLLSQAYVEVLARHGAAHVYNHWSAMPRTEEQAAAIPPEQFAFTVLRLLLRPGRSYARERENFLPFDRIVEPDHELRQEAAKLIRRAVARRQETFVLVNNKAEGSAPLTIEEIAALVAKATH